MVLGASFFNKRLHLQIRRPAAIPFILADRGGEGEEGIRAVAASSGQMVRGICASGSKCGAGVAVHPGCCVVGLRSSSTMATLCRCYLWP
jgi:hypothetical protein